MTSPKKVVITGGFENINSQHLRLLEAASKLGEVTVLLWPDSNIQRISGKPPEFPMAERLYFLNAVRYVGKVIEGGSQSDLDSLPIISGLRPHVWADAQNTANPARAEFCRKQKITCHVFTLEELKGFPEPAPLPPAPGKKKVVVTGSYDWFHSGHVRFMEEASTYGDLYVIVGHDANIRLLKGDGHPLLKQDERRFVVGSIKYVKQALISSGSGWLDADPEIKQLKPDIYIVNEDGDKGGKREYCRKMGIEYIVLKRIPAPGLPKRSSTDLRGF
jgi:cytidyltransferase-like protein